MNRDARGEGAEAGATVAALAAYRFFFLLPNFWLSDWPDRRGDAAAGPTAPSA